MYFLYRRYLFLFFAPYKHRGALPKILVFFVYRISCLCLLAAWFFVVVDVHGQSAALYDAFWPVFLFRRGLRQGEALPAPKYRHLMTYYDNRFAQDMGLLFCLANTRKMRHEVNQAASTEVHSSGRAFEQFKEAINDKDFEDLLKDAQAEPKGLAAQDLLKKVLPLLNISSGQFF